MFMQFVRPIAAVPPLGFPARQTRGGVLGDQLGHIRLIVVGRRFGSTRSPSAAWA